MSRHAFDDETLDEPKHCGDVKTWCDPDPVFHIIAYPSLKILLAHPDSLHVRTLPAACGCRCEPCAALNALREKNEESAVKHAYEAYERGEPIVDPRCSICRIKNRTKKNG